MTMFSDRTDEVDAVCCQQAGDPNQCGNSGAPTGCDYECSLMYVPWFNECHELIEQFVGAQLPQFDSTYRQCQNQDPHDVLREIYDLEQQGCAVQLPPGQVDSEALIMLDRELCSENGAAKTSAAFIRAMRSFRASLSSSSTLGPRLAEPSSILSASASAEAETAPTPNPPRRAPSSAVMARR